MSEQPKTAYEQSITAAQAMLQSAQLEQQAQEKASQYKTLHKKAFRVAFDLMEKLWPPENTEEYWKLVTDRMALDYHDNKENLLCGLLILAVTEYLEKVSKEGEQRGISGISENKEDRQ